MNDRSQYGGRRNLRVWQHVVASCSGAIVTSLTMTPFDVVKIRLQSQRKPLRRGDCFIYCNGLLDHICHCNNGPTSWYSPKNGQVLRGTFHAFKVISQQEGPRTLWSGLSPTLVMAIPATVVYFTIYENMKAVLGYDPTKQQPQLTATAGSVARVLSVLGIAPLEAIRTKLQSEKLSPTEAVRLVRHQIRLAGLRSLWVGTVPTILRDVPFSAIYWYNFELLRSSIVGWCSMGSKGSDGWSRRLGRHLEHSHFALPFICGSISGAFAAIVTLPFDVIKTTKQIELGRLKATDLANAPSARQVVVDILRLNGFRGLFAGAAPRIAKVAPACAIMISSFEYVKAFYNTRNV